MNKSKVARKKVVQSLLKVEGVQVYMEVSG